MIRAFTDRGSTVLDPRYGATVEDMHANLTADTLTGSAVPLDAVRLATVYGDEILYADVLAFVEEGANVVRVDGS